jgi:hypothetical protein
VGAEILRWVRIGHGLHNTSARFPFSLYTSPACIEKNNPQNSVALDPAVTCSLALVAARKFCAPAVVFQLENLHLWKNFAENFSSASSFCCTTAIHRSFSVSSQKIF